MKILAPGILIISFLASFALARVGGDNITFEVKKEGHVIFGHESHVDVGLNCTACHDSLYVTKEKHKPVTMVQMQKGLSCGACHNGKKAFDVKGKESCDNCHKK